jgi:hypothetical protein
MLFSKRCSYHWPYGRTEIFWEWRFRGISNAMLGELVLLFVVGTGVAVAGWAVVYVTAKFQRLPIQPMNRVPTGRTKSGGRSRS